VSTRVQLTPFSRECASLWRELFGNRYGHYNTTATKIAAEVKRRSKSGSFSGAARGVLAAARLAIASRRLNARRGRSSASAVHSGAGTAESALWNDSMRKFHERSRSNIPGVTQTRAGPRGPFVNPAGVSLLANCGAKAQPLARERPYRKVASFCVTDMCPVRGSEIVTGLHRCAEADLVIVPDLTILHDVDALAANVDLVVSFLYIVSIGVDVATSTQLSAAKGRPTCIPLQHCVRHIPAMAEQPLARKFFVGARLLVEHADVHTALRRLARRPGSKFVLSETSDPAPGGISFQTLGDVVAWASSVCRVQHVLGPKAVTSDGVPMPA